MERATRGWQEYASKAAGIGVGLGSAVGGADLVFAAAANCKELSRHAGWTQYEDASCGMVVDMYP
eukprot:CAMPEP_0114268354 /NCGR_PEP_ID=MMETSP0058-20121206/25891_1 /TAXON_ID=36894 /ORGANISM="Pyramimonas parkeae, CCMP726" /LENGTH=64 /DNA_ID=CAMNT_0001386481 /DNA_START=85 /DNA_END=279 /DNA_ORIENTATION=-